MIKLDEIGLFLMGVGTLSLAVIKLIEYRDAHEHRRGMRALDLDLDEELLTEEKEGAL